MRGINLNNISDIELIHNKVRVYFIGVEDNYRSFKFNCKTKAELFYRQIIQKANLHEC